MTDIEYLKKYLKDEDLEECLKKLKQGKPVQYIVGNVDFYGLKFKVDENVLIPRFETEELIEKLILYTNKYFNDNINILDIGSGTGCIAITLSKKLNCSVDSVDISEEALKVAKENNFINNANVNFYLSDIFSNVNSKYDIIVSNPPYIAYEEEIMQMVENNEPHVALYAEDNGLYFYKEILKKSHNYLNKKNIIAFEIGQTQGTEIKKIALSCFPKAKVQILKDLNKLDRFVFIINEE